MTVTQHATISVTKLAPHVAGEVAVDGAEPTVASRFVSVWAGLGEQHAWAARSIPRLRRRDGGWRIARTNVLLVNDDREMPLIEFRM